MNAKIKCLKCLDTIQSFDRHDFKWCSCGNVFIDGGFDYIRCGGPGFRDDSYEFIPEIKEEGE